MSKDSIFQYLQTMYSHKSTKQDGFPDTLRGFGLGFNSKPKNLYLLYAERFHWKLQVPKLLLGNPCWQSTSLRPLQTPSRNFVIRWKERCSERLKRNGFILIDIELNLFQVSVNYVNWMPEALLPINHFNIMSARTKTIARHAMMPCIRHCTHTFINYWNKKAYNGYIYGRATQKRRHLCLQRNPISAIPRNY